VLSQIVTHQIFSTSNEFTGRSKTLHNLRRTLSEDGGADDKEDAIPALRRQRLAGFSPVRAGSALLDG
jgi:hypothetical protein